MWKGTSEIHHVVFLFSSSMKRVPSTFLLCWNFGPILAQLALVVRRQGPERGAYLIQELRSRKLPLISIRRVWSWALQLLPNSNPLLHGHIFSTKQNSFSCLIFFLFVFLNGYMEIVNLIIPRFVPLFFLLIFVGFSYPAPKNFSFSTVFWALKIFRTQELSSASASLRILFLFEGFS